MRTCRRWALAGLVVALLPTRAYGGQEPRNDPAESTGQDGADAAEEYEWSHQLMTGMAVPLTGSIGLGWNRPISTHLELGSYVAYFNRDWLVLLDDGDWHSHSVYLGTMLKYYPTTADHTGYYVGGDIGLATSYQTYRPVDDGDIFWFPYVELYFFGWHLPVYGGFFLDLVLGGGYAPVSLIVEIQGHRNEGDFYPLADLRLGARW